MILNSVENKGLDSADGVDICKCSRPTDFVAYAQRYIRNCSLYCEVCKKYIAPRGLTPEAVLGALLLDSTDGSVPDSTIPFIDNFCIYPC